jgi:hypothetical protein
MHTFVSKRASVGGSGSDSSVHELCKVRTTPACQVGGPCAHPHLTRFMESATSWHEARTFNSARLCGQQGNSAILVNSVFHGLQFGLDRRLAGFSL